MWHTVYICPNFTCQTSFNPSRPTTAPAAEPVGCFNGQGSKKRQSQKTVPSYQSKRTPTYPRHSQFPKTKGTPNHKLFVGWGMLGVVLVCSRGMFGKLLGDDIQPPILNHTITSGKDFPSEITIQSKPEQIASCLVVCWSIILHNYNGIL